MAVKASDRILLTVDGVFEQEEYFGGFDPRQMRGQAVYLGGVPDTVTLYQGAPRGFQASGWRINAHKNYVGSRAASTCSVWRTSAKRSMKLPPASASG